MPMLSPLARYYIMVWLAALMKQGCADPSTDSFKIVENFKRQGNIVSCRLEELKDYFQEKTKSALPQTLGHD